MIFINLCSELFSLIEMKRNSRQCKFRVMPGTFRRYSKVLHYECPFWSAMCTEKFACSLLIKELTQRAFIIIKAVFLLDIAAWLQLLWIFSLLIFFLSLVFLQSTGRKYSWTAWQFYQDLNCWSNVKQDTFNCFRERLMLLKREAQECHSEKQDCGAGG